MPSDRDIVEIESDVPEPLLHPERILKAASNITIRMAGFRRLMILLPRVFVAFGPRC
jgi:hypothetical protein